MGLKMETKDLDIVYCVKDRPLNEELRYSLRSLKNLPHRKVWIYGGCPEWVNKRNVKHVPIVQDKENKWQNAAHLLRLAVENDNISENFIWFNDDFFVMKPTERLYYYKDRTLASRAYDFAKLGWWAINGAYPTRLKKASRALHLVGRPTDNYELHLPIIFNREKLLACFFEFPGLGARRSLYSNMYEVESIQSEDVKIYDLFKTPNVNWTFVSTTDDSFARGRVGEYIRIQFSKKSKYEKEVK